MHIEQAIKDAAAAGYAERKDSMETGTAWRNRFLLDPAFWQALGKARGWERRTPVCIFDGDMSQFTGFDEKCPSCGRELTHPLTWKYQWHCFIDHLAEGKDAESFFAELLK